MSHHPAYTLSALCTIGGTVGFLRQRSRASLAAGLAFGALYGASGYLLKTTPTTAPSSRSHVARAPRRHGPAPLCAARSRTPSRSVSQGLAGSAYYGKKWYEWTYGV
ncbi:hypothetical protein AMAG_01256 [Allomyces macrogynus ATCC 38327]|uniref:Transmembrane protein 14C n=1 Tax=Allomyces macrogynus (strain ATCC 38327) TaxID=578462 RepID=A0A0L0RZ48_ALLM3|nr:hypothetical protein AMAG_01256 [Allomyces macrogynus ATCC 38327]|eukprot:KNE55356.1 hypothetical protein AMAG_01256 [Allomyces macrogynus ATCC 38327]